MADDRLPVQLQPPGAGLPLPELWLSRAGLWLLRKVQSPARATAKFRAEGERILTLARSLDPALAARPVLIRRVWGMEDSSRNWSVLMVLDHLVIVNAGVAAIVEHLAAGQTLDRVVSTAAVKPGPVQDAGVIDRYAASVRDYAARADALGPGRSRVAHRHPWFGPMDAHGWHGLAATHQTVHRRQIERIIRSLRRG